MTLTLKDSKRPAHESNALFPMGLYSLYCREGKFSETGLPALPILGNTEAKKHRKSRGLTTPGLFLQVTAERPSVERLQR